MGRCIATLLLAATAAAAADTGYGVRTLQSPPRIEYLISRDLNADGLDDVIAVNGVETWIWYGRRAGTLPAAPDRKLRLPEGTALFDLGDPDGKGTRLIARTAEGYFEVEADGSGVRRLPFRAGAGVPRRPANVLWRGFFAQLDGTGPEELIDVSLDGYAIHYAGLERVVLPPSIREQADTRGGLGSGRWHTRYAMARWTAGRFDADDKTDFAVVTDEGLTVYPGDSNGRANAERVFAIPIPEARDSDLRFLDIDGDGRTDLFALRAKEGRATILRADPEKGLAAPQRTLLSVAGEIQPPVLADLNGDGRLDIGLPYLASPSVQDAVRIALRGELLVRVAIFLNRGAKAGSADGVIGTRADRRLTVPVRIRLVTDSAGRIFLSGLVVVEYGGDLDGDGRRDLLVSQRTDLLAIHPGGGPEIFADRPSATIPVPDSAPFDAVRSTAANLNGDNRSDIILHYRGSSDRPDRLHLLLSRKK